MVLSRSLALLLLAATLASSAHAASRESARKPAKTDAAKESAADRAADSAVESARRGQYVVRAAPFDDVAFEAPKLPDLAPYTAEAVRKKIGRVGKGRVAVRRMVDMQTLDEFVGGQNRLGEWAARQTQNPVAIVIENGAMTPRDLAAALPPAQFAQTADGVYIARLPLVVAQGGTFVVDESVKELRLSEERGAFVVNDGRLFMIDTRLVAWREKEDGPARFQGDGKRFRPFLVAWGGSETYVAGTQVESLGYAASKAYGFSISQYSPSMHVKMKRPPPYGWLLDSTFVDHWYGFYCYEADNLVLVGNTYRDNIVYGIDPHDRSHGLIIANNKAHGTKQKHGIIVSREVNDSWIFGNRAWNNGLSGIVIDRSSVRNVVADNVTYDNGSDGITIYESPDNLIWRNHSIGNANHGIRVRNSVRVRLQDNRASANGRAGVYGHIKDLSGTDRNLRLDPFDPNVSMVIVGGELAHNLSAPVTIDRPLSVELYDVDLLAPPRAAGIRFTGVLGEYQDRLLDLLVRQRVPVVIEPAGGAGRSGS